MIIEQITLSNWLSYPAKWQQNGKLIEPSLRFDQEQAYLIFGKNGAGKSAIMEAILFALFGDYSRAAERQDIKRDGAIRTGETTAIIELIFRLNGKRHKIRRVLTQSTAKAEYSSWDAKGQKWILETAQVKTVNAKITDLLGLNQGLFCGTVILEQGKTGRFMELKPGEQVDHIKNLLGLNIYSTYYEKAKELANQRKSELRKIEEDLKGLTDVSKETLENAEKETKKLEKSLERIDGNIRYLEQLHTQVRFVEGIRSELSVITQKIDGFETQLTQKDEIERAAQIIREWEEIQKIIKEVRRIQKQLSDQQYRLDNLQAELTGKKNARFDNQNNLDKEYKPEYKKIEATLEKVKGTLKTKRKKLTVSENQRNLFKAELDLDRRQSEIQTQQKERQQQLAEVAQIETEYRLWNELNEIVPKLETLVSTLIKSHEEAIAVAKSQQILEKELKDLGKRRIEFEQLKEQGEALNDQLNAAEELEEDIRRQQKADEDLLDKREAAHGKSICPTCGTSLEGKELDRIHHELLELRKKVKSGKSLLKETRQNTAQIKEQAEQAKKQYRHEEKEIDREESRLTAEQEIIKSRENQARKQEKDALKKWELLKGKINYSVQLISDPTKNCLQIAQKKQKTLKDIQKRYTQLMQTQAEFNTAQTELENILGQRQYPMGTYSQAQLKEANNIVTELEGAIERDEHTLEIKKEEERKLYQLLTKTDNEISGLSGRIQDIEQKSIPKEQEIYLEIECHQEEILGRVEKRLATLDWSTQYLKDLRRSINKEDQKAEQKLNDWIEGHRLLSNQLSELQAAEKQIGGLRSRYTALDEQIKRLSDDIQQGKSKTIEKNLEAPLCVTMGETKTA